MLLNLAAQARRVEDLTVLVIGTILIDLATELEEQGWRDYLVEQGRASRQSVLGCRTSCGPIGAKWAGRC